MVRAKYTKDDVINMLKELGFGHKETYMYSCKHIATGLYLSDSYGNILEEPFSYWECLGDVFINQHIFELKRTGSIIRLKSDEKEVY